MSAEQQTGSGPHLSVVIPVYNEQACIQANLRQVLDYLSQQPFPSEVIVVDDGSRDDTAALVGEVAHSAPSLRLIRNDHRGKAYAVRTGVLAAEGDYVLFADADLATPIHQAEKLLAALESGYDVAIGSREGYGARRYNEPWTRHLMGRVFNLVVRALVMGQHRDTQCGFKAFTRAAAQDIFRSVHLYGPSAPVLNAPLVTGFDVELLYLAHLKGYRVADLPVEWHYGPGSKVNPLRDSWRNFKDVLRVRYYALCGRYGE
ncbi:MAG: glycosyltransferase family 2 protein [Anaerolineae bacterium]|nr:glycosyltransferase family 2 protein [Anaerolineae bacterium]